MKLNEAQEILNEGKKRLCVLNPLKNHEQSGELCVILNIKKGWIEIESGLWRLNVRASEIEVLHKAKEMGWR